MPSKRRVLFIFLDGVGVGPSDPILNPFLTARLPTLSRLLHHQIPVLDGSTGRVTGQRFQGGHGGPAEAAPAETPRPTPGHDAVLLPLDPLMEMEGLPQSGTGQTALFTGENAALLYGRHFGPWVPVPLRPLLMEKNILTLAQEQGLSCAFANAYPSQYIHRARTKRPAAPPLVAYAAGLLTRTEEQLEHGEAVSSEMLNEAWRTRLGLTHLPQVTAEEAGQNLATIASRAELTLFAHYATDTAGHDRTLEAGAAALERVDAFLAGLLSTLPAHTLLVLASDHGNIEDVSKGHTTNPTFNLLYGPGATALGRGLTKITDLAGTILEYLTAHI